ncbi:MAG: hypothetical protein KGH61_02060 [Candidatus Micrarchaeota archaeon]|nr:hypothetical protein [Candidatus Micrarchaeota archaeon]MDE1847715.1 hypothetical protein [Candidatus Micrarchaeota archaeon]MDE1864144.1 hypothetical protein [Candidatus Micrarchaeota archaeon]
MASSAKNGMNGYLITKDIVPTLINKYDIKELKVLGHACKQLKRLEDEFISEFKWTLGDKAVIKKVDAESLASDMKSKLTELREANPNHILISLDRVYVPMADHHIEVTRGLDPHTSQSLHGVNRHNTMPVEVQITDLRWLQDIKKRNNMGRPLMVILTDVGAFDGTTLKMLVSLLQENGIKVDKIVLGVSTSWGHTALKDAYGDSVFVCNLYDDIYEWMELRDLMLIDGRQAVMGHYVNGIRHFVPYSEMLVKEAHVINIASYEKAARKTCYKFYNQVMELLDELQINRDRVGKHVMLAKRS